VIGFILLVGSVLGRFVCGFLCPFGFVQDLLYKIRFFKKLRRLPAEKLLRKLKYVLLLLFVLLLPALVLDPFGQGLPWFCKWICPSGTLFGGIPLVALNEGLKSAAGWLFAWKVFLLAAILFLSLAVYRPFCRYLCPLGALYGFLNPISIYRIRVKEHNCTSCKACQKACKLDIPIYVNPSSMECIRCGDCVRACPHAAICIGLREKKEEKGCAC
jgi:polyferredoxin